jgi:heterodisulfide reductase subunit B
MEFSYYPGCTLTGSAVELDESFRGAADKLNISLKEIPDWTCCGASSAHMVDEYLETALPARDLMAAEEMGADVVAPCAACHLRLKAASKKIAQDQALRADFPLKGNINILSGLEMFARDDVLALLRKNVVKPLKDLRVVPYYGCLAVRPPEIVEPDDPENPKQMDRVLEALGATVVNWPYKTDCCGGSLALTRTDLVLKLSRKLLDMAGAVDADAMVTFCPMCQANIDTRQEEISAETGKLYQMPVIYVTELIGLAFDNAKAGSWFQKHLVSPERVLSAKGLL